MCMQGTKIGVGHELTIVLSAYLRGNNRVIKLKGFVLLLKQINTYVGRLYIMKTCCVVMRLVGHSANCVCVASITMYILRMLKFVDVYSFHCV